MKFLSYKPYPVASSPGVASANPGDDANHPFSPTLVDEMDCGKE